MLFSDVRLNLVAAGWSLGLYKTTILYMLQDSLVDWSKPIFWQVGDLGDKYFEWAHIPTDQPLRLFHNEICEFFSKSYWWLILLYWVPITLGTIYYSYSQFLEHSIPWNIIGLGSKSSFQVFGDNYCLVILCNVLFM